MIKLLRVILRDDEIGRLAWDDRRRLSWDDRRRLSYFTYNPEFTQERAKCKDGQIWNTKPTFG